MSATLHDLTLRDVYGRTLLELYESNRRIVVIEADLGASCGSLLFRERYPERFVEVGVAEANMIGIAAGFAVEGEIPFCSSFTAFASRRVYDQVAVSVAYSNSNVKITGSAPGITAYTNGGTHMCFEDMALMRVLPNMTVLSPADAYELRECMHWSASSEGPVYMQLLRQKLDPLVGESYRFKPGRAIVLSEGSDVTLVSTGLMTHYAREAARRLTLEGIGVHLLHCPCIKPFPEGDLVASARRTGCVVTVENQNIIGGLGGAVAEALGERCPVRVRRLGMPDAFGELVRNDSYMLDKHGFGPDHIVAACRELALARSARLTEIGWAGCP